MGVPVTSPLERDTSAAIREVEHELTDLLHEIDTLKFRVHGAIDKLRVIMAKETRQASPTVMEQLKHAVDEEQRRLARALGDMANQHRQAEVEGRNLPLP
jgi:hypothetical protein